MVLIDSTSSGLCLIYCVFSLRLKFVGLDAFVTSLHNFVVISSQWQSK